MTLKIFFTGITGYVGGDAFVGLYDKHPEYEYSVLVRSSGERAAAVKKVFPTVRLVIGSLDDSAIIEKEAAAADVVIHTADSADHEAAAKAISKGLAEGHSPEKPGYWIHLSGSGVLIWYDHAHQRFGEAPLPEQEYRDIRDIDRLLTLPDAAPHRAIDKIILAANSPTVRVAFVSPPTIYGEGRGPGNTRSIQVPDLAKATLENGFAPVVAPGRTEWDNVHVRDLSALFVALAEATRDPARNADPDVFGPRAYYFAEGGAHVWADVARWVARESHALGYLPAPLTKDVMLMEAAGYGGVANATWGLNSKGKAERARKYLGWEAREKSLEDEVAVTVSREAARLNLQPLEKK